MTIVDWASPLLMVVGAVVVVVGALGASGRWRLFPRWPADSSLNRRGGVGVVVTGVGMVLHAIGRLLVSTFGTVLLIGGAVLLVVGVTHGLLLTVRSSSDQGE